MASSQVCVDMNPQNGKERGDAAVCYQPLGVNAQQPRDFVLFSLFNFVVINSCCLGFAALVYSIKSRDCKVAGDPEGAARYGRKAKCLNILGFILNIVIFLVVIFMIYALKQVNRVDNQQWEINPTSGTFSFPH